MIRLLYIEDNKILLNLTKIFLEKNNFEVYTATDGFTGISLAREHTPDIILCDINMPGIDGYGVFNELQADEKTAIIPFIFISANSKLEDIRNGMTLGADDYITKPFTNEQLLAAIHTRLKRQNLFQKSSEQKNKIFVEEIETKNKILKQAFDIIRAKNKDIIDSIEYAQQIQAAILEPGNFIHEVFAECFIIHKPKAIVSGDFYYFDKKDDYAIIAAVDCTGHGVPGALLSIIGYNLLNQAINVHHLTAPAEILAYINRSIICSLKQKKQTKYVKESMDIALCSINMSTLDLQFAGAGNPVYLFRKQQLLRFKPDYYAIGSPDEDQAIDFKFTQYNVSLQKGDTIYLFSDGYADQFGGLKRKKMLTRGFREKLIEIQPYNLKQQEEILVKYFDEWKGDYEQTDDVLIIGVRL